MAKKSSKKTDRVHVDDRGKRVTYHEKRRRKAYLDETRDSSGNIKIPLNVTNKEKYLLYVKMHDEMVNSDNYMYQTSDPSLIVNTVTLKHVLANRISHLPVDEQETILKIADRMRSMSATIGQLKKQAFQNSTKSDIEDGTERNHTKFFGERGAELIEYFGRYFTLNEVHKIVRHEWNYPLMLNTLRIFREDNLDKIRERQEEFKASYGDVRLGHKRSRLEELEYLFKTRRDIYARDKNREDSKELRAIIEQVRKEIDGDTLTINGAFHVEHEHRVQVQINEQLMKGLNLKALVLSRVAAKFNRNPVVLQYQLLKSYYAKHTGFAEADGGDPLKQEIVYPSSLIYDFDVIKKKNEQVAIEESKLVEEFPLSSEDKHGVIEDTKSVLLKKLLEQRSMNSKTKDRINTRGKSGLKDEETNI